MKLLYFTRADSPHDRRFLAAFSAQGVTVGYLALRSLPAAAGDASASAGVERLGSLGCDGVSPEGFAAAAKKLRATAERFGADLLVAGPLTDCGYVAARAALACPWVLQSWAFDVYWEAVQEPGADQRVREALQGGAALFVDSQAVRERCEAIAGRRFAASFIMPWGIEPLPPTPVEVRARLRRELGLAEGRPVFLHNRHLEPVYSVPTVVAAFRELVRREPAAMLLLASEGSLRPELERFIRENSLGENVRMLGAAPHARALELLAAADFFVSHAASDGTSVSLLEAMAAGLPAIVSDCGGNREWVQPGENGWVVPLGDAGRLAAAMGAAIHLSAASRRSMGEAGRGRVAARADWRANFPGYVGFLRACASGPLPKGKGPP